MSGIKVGAGGEAGGDALPEGWAWATVGDVLIAPIANGRSVRTEDGGFPVLRLTALRSDKVDLAERKEGEWTADEAAPFLVRANDFLICRGSGSLDLVGRGALVPEAPDPVAFPDTMIRVRVPVEHMSPRFFTRLWASPLVREQVEAAARTTAGIYKVSQPAVRELRIPVPPTAEQHRIAAALDTRMARLDAVDRAVTSARRDLATLRKAVLLDAVPEPEQWPAHWTATTTGKAGTVELGRARHPDWHTGPKVRPYLRVANVFEDRIDSSDVKVMDFSGVFGKYRLEPGDILLNEGQSPHLVGRPAMYRGIPEGVAFTNSLLRFRASGDVLPGWALLVFRRHLHAGRFMREVRITTNLAHLSGARLKTVEFPVPPLDEQRHLVRTTKQRLAAFGRIERGLDRVARHNSAVRRALLSEAFSGRLVPQDPADESAEELLKQIRMEREAAEAERKAARTAARTGRKAKSDTIPPPPASADDTTLADGEQTALFLEFNP
ncbi:restriction endonuclease subunit S [Streptomyces sp. NPDC126514]|uniref:restriction endonuclease subunit S n=1 Tax=Streptomyces sp. NPDC126514 TaxID=3155210 RepID=UPI003324896A